MAGKYFLINKIKLGHSKFNTISKIKKHLIKDWNSFILKISISGLFINL